MIAIAAAYDIRSIVVLFALCLLAVSMFGCSATVTPATPAVPEITRNKLLPPGPGNPRNSQGDFITLKDGKILFIYTHYTSAKDDNSNSELVSRFSTDGGRTWSTENVPVVGNEGGDGTGNVVNVSLLRLQDGRIAMFYLVKKKAPGSKLVAFGGDYDCRPVMRISTDEAATWGPPRVCIPDAGFHILNNCRVIQLESGRLVMPIARHDDPAQPNNFNNKPLTSCWLSDDNGLTWRRSKNALTGASGKRKVALQEPGVVELKDGRLMMFCRTHARRIYISYSSDQGETWSVEEPMQGIWAALSAPAIKRIPQTGDLLLVWDDHSIVTSATHPYEGKRTPFTVAISRDEGATWEKIKNIEDDVKGWYCYVAITFVGDNVLLGHCAGIRDTEKHLDGLETTQITRFNLAWLYQEKP